MDTEKFELLDNGEDGVEVQFENEDDQNLNPNVDDQLSAAHVEQEDAAPLSAEEKVRKYLESDDDLKEYGDDVQRRINKLTYNWRESERREQAAVQYAQQVHNENQTLRTQQVAQDGVVIDEHKNRLEAQLETAKQQLKEAYEAQDPGLIAEANQNIASYASDLRSAQHTEHRFKRNQQQPQQQFQQPQQQFQQPQQQQRPPPDERAEKWAGRNKWFGEDHVMTNAAMTIHQDLIQEGYAPESDNYYQTLDSRLQSNFPHKFQKPRAQGNQTVTPGNNQDVRRKGGKRHVKLTASQVNIAKRLGVPLEEYAKYV